VIPEKRIAAAKVFVVHADRRQTAARSNSGTERSAIAELTRGSMPKMRRATCGIERPMLQDSINISRKNGVACSFVKSADAPLTLGALATPWPTCLHHSLR
jgi:hypothetical protein